MAHAASPPADRLRPRSPLSAAGGAARAASRPAGRARTRAGRPAAGRRGERRGGGLRRTGGDADRRGDRPVSDAPAGHRRSGFRGRRGRRARPPAGVSGRCGRAGRAGHGAVRGRRPRATARRDAEAVGDGVEGAPRRRPGGRGRRPLHRPGGRGPGAARSAGDDQRGGHGGVPLPADRRPARPGAGGGGRDGRAGRPHSGRAGGAPAARRRRPLRRWRDLRRGGWRAARTRRTSARGRRPSRCASRSGSPSRSATR